MRSTIFLAILSLSLISCTQPEVVITKVVYKEKKIPIVKRPRPVSVSNIGTYVVNESNIDEFIAEFSDKPFIVLTVQDYEKLVVNLAEIKRYITQSKQVIVYYENSLKQDSN